MFLGSARSTLFVLFFYLWVAVGGLVHAYANSELIDDHGCSVGSLFCHGHTKFSSAVSIQSPLQYLDFIETPLYRLPYLEIIHVHSERGPPSLASCFILV